MKFRPKPPSNPGYKPANPPSLRAGHFYYEKEEQKVPKDDLVDYSKSRDPKDDWAQVKNWKDPVGGAGAPKHVAKPSPLQ
jgi:hypothetical protein